MLISEIKEIPLRYQPTAGSKREKFTALHDFKAAMTATWGVVKKTTDDTKVTYYLTKNGLVAGYWNGFDSLGIVYKK